MVLPTEAAEVWRCKCVSVWIPRVGGAYKEKPEGKEALLLREISAHGCWNN